MAVVDDAAGSIAAADDADGDRAFAPHAAADKVTALRIRRDRDEDKNILDVVDIVEQTANQFPTIPLISLPMNCGVKVFCTEGNRPKLKMNIIAESTGFISQCWRACVCVRCIHLHTHVCRCMHR